MNPEKVVFSFFIVMALTLNFGFCLGDIDNQTHHHVYELAAVIIVNLVATILKFGDRSHVGALLLSTSLVADLQLPSLRPVFISLYHFALIPPPSGQAFKIALKTRRPCIYWLASFCPDPSSVGTSF